MGSTEAWDQALAAVHAAGEAAVLAMANTARDRTQALTPRDRGDLAGSYFVETQGLDGQMGTDLDYAVYVHEDLTDQHDDGQAKFMEAAVTGAESAQAIGAAAAQAAEAALS